MKKNYLKQSINAINNFLNKNKYSGIIIAFVAFVIVALLSHSQLYDMFELKLYDFRVRVKPSLKEFDRLTFLDIDENSITTVGEFPWPRAYYRKGMLALNKLGVKQAAFDIMFPDNSPTVIKKDEFINLKKKAHHSARIKSADLDSLAIDNDALFADGLKEYKKAILAYTFSPKKLHHKVLDKQNSNEFKNALKLFEERSTIKIPHDKLHLYKDIEDKESVSISYPIPLLMASAKSCGFVNRHTDIDGTLRRVKLVNLFKDRIYFNLALAMLIDLCKVKKENIVIEPGKYILLKQAFNPQQHAITDIKIPIDKRGMMYVNWARPGPHNKSFHSRSFYALIDYYDGYQMAQSFFDDSEANRKTYQRSQLYAELAPLIEQYSQAKDSKTRLETWNKMKQIRKKITDIKKSYLADYAKAVEQFAIDAKKTKDPAALKQLEELKNNIKAFELAIWAEDELPDQIVMSGLTAIGTHDIGVVPLTNEYARVGVYHNTINTIIQGSYITKVGYIINYMLMLLLALAMGYIIPRLDAKKSLLTISAAFIIVNTIIMLIFIFNNLWVQQLGISMALLLPSLIITGVKFLSEEEQKKFIKNAFSYYLSPGVIDKIIKNPESLQLGGENRVITLFFSDIAKFSTISEMLSAKDLVQLLNEYLSEMTNIVLKYQGTVDKFIGDAVMAFYGAPHPFPDHATKACLAAIEMRDRLADMRAAWKKKGQVQLHARMGLNTGDVVVGNMGSNTRMDYTAMGDTVNLASRLEGANKNYNTEIMISQFTYSEVKDIFDARRLDKVRVVGKDEPIIIYELMGKKDSLTDQQYALLEKYNLGMEEFKNRQWKRAKAYFNEGLKIIKNDGPCLTYINRCDEYMKKPPTKKWDGVYTFKTK